MSQRRERSGLRRRLPLDRVERAVDSWLPVDRLVEIGGRLSLVRVAALSGAAGLLFSVLLVLHGVVDTVGETALFYPVVAVPLVAATVLARSLRVQTAITIGAGLLAAGLAWHLAALEGIPDPLLILGSNVELLTGRRVLEIRRADVWALGVTPTPVFVTWYLALRREYVGAALVGGGMLGYFVLTGDAVTTVTLLGVVSAAALIGFGDLDNSEWAGGTADYVALALAVMVVTPLVVTIVPGGAATPVTFVGGDDGTTLEENVIGSESDLQVVGSVDQSPAVRFTVTADEPRYWRTGSFDRYTGDGWIRSGGESSYDSEDLPDPPGEVTYLRQRVDVETDLGALPAAWRPVELSTSVTDRAQITDNGGLQVDGTVEAGESYQVFSAVTNPTPRELNDAGTDYPQEIANRYTQLPDSTPDRVGERTEQLISEAETPYEAARVIEQWLEINREYSLDVDRPDGNIADAFLFEMEAGYCTYYATTMVTMLRTQDVPARLAVGYNAGQPVGDDRYAVRGLNSHAWVEVYFPEVGWVPFDPTPSDPRQEVEQAAVDRAREQGASGVDTEETEPEQTGPGDIATPARPAANDTETQPAPGLEQIGRDALTDRGAEEGVGDVGPDFERNTGFQGIGGTSNASEIDESEGDSGSGEPALPPHEQLALGAVALIGAVAGLRQSRVARRVSRAARIRFQRRHDPATDVERAHERLMLLLEGQHRPRRTGETTQQYLDAIGAGQRARRVVELRERARYGDEVSKAAANEAISLVESIRESR